ncbi:MAG: hypothetical protein D6692_04630, partial [Planctomycetota bacterium]
MPRSAILFASFVLLLLAGGGPHAAIPGGELQPVIVQGADAGAVAQLVRRLGAEPTHHLPIIDAVGARLSAAQRAALARHPQVRRIWDDRPIAVTGAG